MTRNELLHRHVEEIANKPITWGFDDCSPWCARWLHKSAGILVRINLVYNSRDEAVALIKNAGGLPNLWERFLSVAGVEERIGPPELGDIGLVNTETWGPIGVIFATNGIAICRGDAGASLLLPRERDIVKIWACPEP